MLNSKRTEAECFVSDSTQHPLRHHYSLSSEPFYIMKLSKALAILSSLSVGSPIIAADNDNQVIDACAEYDQSYLGAETKLEYCEMGYNDGREAGYEIGYGWERGRI